MSLARIVLVHAPSGSLPRVHQYMNYHPFGEVLEEYGSYNTNFKYTGKEHDRHSSFDYVYFGARYYRPKLGQFASIDKASQFASGYVYGANNPLIGVDPDGSLFWVPIILGAVAGAYSGAQIAAATEGDIFGHMLAGAFIGAVSGFVGSSLSAAAGGIEGSLLGGASAGALHGGGMATLAGAEGKDIWRATWQSAVSGASGAYVGGALSRGVPGTLSSFAGGFVSGAVGYSLSHSDRTGVLDNVLAAGIVSGSVSAATYQIEAQLRYRRKTFDAAVDHADREQLSIVARKSLPRGNEYGGYIDQNKDVVVTGVGTEKHVNFRIKSDAPAGFHTHTYGALKPGEVIVHQHSALDINELNLKKFTSVVLSPKNVYVMYPGDASPTNLGAINRFLMVNYYNIAYYGDYWQYANKKY